MLSHLCPPGARSRSRSQFLALSEALESRQLLSAQTSITYETYLDGVQVRIVGTDGDDQIMVRRDPSLGLVITNSADNSFTAYGGAVKTVRVEGGAGNDTILIDPTVVVR